MEDVYCQNKKYFHSFRQMLEASNYVLMALHNFAFGLEDTM